MAKLYHVKASLKGQSIWSFRAIVASNEKDAIADCKYTMKHIMGTIPKYKWTAESEWENNLSVN